MIDLGTVADDAELSFDTCLWAEIGTLNLGIGNTPTGPFSTVFPTLVKFKLVMQPLIKT